MTMDWYSAASSSPSMKYTALATFFGGGMLKVLALVCRVAHAVAGRVRVFEPGASRAIRGRYAVHDWCSAMPNVRANRETTR